MIADIEKRQAGMKREGLASEVAWSNRIPDDQWAVYTMAMDAMDQGNVPFLLGGAFALATYTGNWRNTKDLDFFVRERDREQAISLLTGAGMDDYYDQKPYDRGWIYRSCRGDYIVDVIWRMANHRAVVSQEWFDRGTPILIRGRMVQVISAEDLIFCKLYVLQRDRCDWTDIMNVLHAVGPDLDWKGLLDTLDQDVPLLAGAVSVFSWLCPARARQFPRFVWDRLRMEPPRPSENDPDHRRADLLDSRAWFGPKLEPGQDLQL